MIKSGGITIKNFLRQSETEQQLTKPFDLLIEHGADLQEWANRGHFPEPCPMESNRERYLDGL